MKWIWFLLFFYAATAQSCSQVMKFLRSFDRPFTMIAFGDDIDTVLKAGATYPNSVFIIINTEQQVASSLPNLIVLNKKISQKNIRILGQCEDFDVVYIPDPIKTFGCELHRVLREMKNLGQYILISKEKQKKLSILKTKKQYLLRKTWVRNLHSEKSHCIHSTFQEKRLLKCNKALLGNTIVSEWIPGINLITFKMLEGIYPTKKMIIDQLTLLKILPHNDWVINNMILQGENLSLIDWNDPRRGEKAFCSDRVFQNHVKIIEMDNTHKIKNCLISGIK